MEQTVAPALAQTMITTMQPDWRNLECTEQDVSIAASPNPHRSDGSIRYEIFPALFYKGEPKKPENEPASLNAAAQAVWAAFEQMLLAEGYEILAVYVKDYG